MGHRKSLACQVERARTSAREVRRGATRQSRFAAASKERMVRIMPLDLPGMTGTMDVKVRDASGAETQFIQVGQSFTIELDWTINGAAVALGDPANQWHVRGRLESVGPPACARFPGRDPTGLLQLTRSGPTGALHRWGRDTQPTRPASGREGGFVASDETQTSGQLSEEPSDDLTRIPDLSPATGERLRRAGVRTYADLAASPPQEIARITRRSPQRVAELDWVGHARRLATGSPAGVDSAEATTEEDRQHYESFTVRLLLEDDNAVRRLSVKHTRTLHEEVWNGWEAAKLVDFIAEQADVRTESAPQSKPAATASALVSAPGAETPRRRTQLQVKEVEVVSSGGGHPDLMLHANEPFTVRLTIDLARLEMEGQAPLEYGA